jgi:hypothetical protein
MKKVFDYVVGLQLVCSLTFLTACNVEADVPVVNPEDEWTEAEREYAKSVIGVWTNFNEETEALQESYFLYDVREGGIFDAYMVSGNGDPTAKYQTLSLSGTWKPVLDIEDRWAKKRSVNGIEVTIDTNQLPEDVSRGQLFPQSQTGDGIVKDTLLFVPLDNQKRVSIWISDLDNAASYYQENRMNQTGFKGFWDWVVERIIDTVETIANIGEIINEPINMIIRVIEGKDCFYASGMSDWMSYCYQNKDPRICDMSIPGSHDTFTFSQSWYSMIPTMTRKVKTQELDIESQWDAGVRCFDLRLGKHDDGLGACHGPFYLGVTFDEALKSIATQVKNHKGEMAIVILKFEEDVDETQYKIIYDKVKEYRDQGLVVNNPTPDMRLSQGAGKMLFIQRYGDNKYNLDVRATGWEENSELIFMNDKKAPLHVQDLYESNGDELLPTFISRKEDAMEECFKNSAASKDNTWFFNHGSAYFGISVWVDWTKYLDMNYAEVAHWINPWAATYVEDHYGKKTGVVVMDFAGIDILADGLFFTRGIDLPTYVVENNKHLNNN